MIDAYVSDLTHLHNEWAALHEDLLHCLEHCSDVIIPEDVYACIRAGTASLIMLSRDNDYAGFVVVTVHNDTFRPVLKTLHVWFTHTHGNDVTKVGMEFLRGMARAKGCHVITLRGTREGFLRWGADLGFKRNFVELIAEVD